MLFDTWWLLLTLKGRLRRSVALPRREGSGTLVRRWNRELGDKVRPPPPTGRLRLRTQIHTVDSAADAALQ